MVFATHTGANGLLRKRREKLEKIVINVDRDPIYRYNCGAFAKGGCAELIVSQSHIDNCINNIIKYRAKSNMLKYTKICARV